MKASRLRKKSPVFRQGYRTGYLEGVSMTNNNDDQAAAGRRMAAAGEEQTAVEIAGKYDRGFEAGYAEAAREAAREKTDLTLAGIAIVALIAGSVGFAIGMAVAV